MKEAVILQAGQASVIAPLFAGMHPSLWRSYADGYMGQGWADDPDKPACARVLAGGFCFLAGDASHACAGWLAASLPEDYARPIAVMVPQDAAWADLVTRHHAGRFSLGRRYAMKPGAELSAHAGALPQGYRIAPIDEGFFQSCRNNPLTADLCSQYASFEDFRAKGFGFLALYGSTIVGGTSAFSVYDGGIEIDIVTDPAHRRRGLARICAARMIWECQRRGVEPGWDAANEASCALAEKMGYTLHVTYDAYYISTERRKS